LCAKDRARSEGTCGVAIQVLEMYKRVVRLFGYDIVVEGRTIAMPKKHFVANFIFVRFNVQLKVQTPHLKFH
jgi:hypothetical protein